MCSYSRRHILKAAGGAGLLTRFGTATASHDDPDENPFAGFGGTSCDVSRTSDKYLPFDTDGQYGGWGGHEYHVTDPGLRGDENPVVFVHGNTRDACDFSDHATRYLDRGYGGDQLWSITFHTATSTHAEMARQLDDFVRNIREYTGAETVDVVGHSLGVTGVRLWMADTSEYDWPSVDLSDDHPAASPRFDWVDTFVGLAGANHGTYACHIGGPGCSKGPKGRTTTAEPCNVISPECAQHPGEPLFDLNHYGFDCTEPGAPCEVNETPHDDTTDYFTIRGLPDEFFLPNPDSPALEGASANVVLTGRDHDAARASDTSIELIYQWVTSDSFSSRPKREPNVSTSGSRSDTADVYTAGQTARIELTVNADRPVLLRDRIPYTWDIVPTDQDVTAVAPRPHRGIKEVYFNGARPRKSHEVSYYVEAPSESGSYDFGPAQVRTPAATEWAAVPDTTDRNVVIGISTETSRPSAPPHRTRQWTEEMG